jgi:WD40 repeat protein
VHLFDIKLAQTMWSSPGSHRETIFDVKFKPDNPDCLATSSYDGTVKLWNTRTMTCTMTLAVRLCTLFPL